MPDRDDELLAAIWLDPDDRSLLRVYADWLMEHGSLRGEYMQLLLLTHPTSLQLARAAGLRTKHRGKWLGSARPFVASWTDSETIPGFIDRLHCTAANLIAGFQDLVRLGPRLEISVTAMRIGKRKLEAKLAALPLGKVYALNFFNNELDDTSISTLAPALTGLRRLSLDGNDVTASGIATLGAAVDSLEDLTVDAIDDATDGIAEVIVGARGFRSLQRLTINPNIGGSLPSSPALCDALRALPNLRRLNEETLRSP